MKTKTIEKHEQTIKEYPFHEWECVLRNGEVVFLMAQDLESLVKDYEQYNIAYCKQIS